MNNILCVIRQSVVISLFALTTKSHAQCGFMPNLSPGDIVRAADLPSAYHTVEIHSGMIVFQGWPVQRVGTLTAVHHNYIDQVSSTPVGPEFSVPGSEYGTVNLEPRCETDLFNVEYTSTVSMSEEWSTTSSITHTQAVTESIKFGAENSILSAGLGLQNTSEYSQTTGTSFSINANIGSGSTSTVEREIPPCKKYVVVPVAKAQNYQTIVRTYRTVYDINAYFDITGDGDWDVRGLFSISCDPAGSGTVSAYGMATVFTGDVDIEFRGLRDSEEDCPCDCINSGESAANGCDGGWGDTDGDGIPDVDDSDMDGDGIGNDHDNDTDGDGIPNDQDPDDDNDGILDGDDDSPTGIDESDDIDGDGVLNEDDDDIDGDGILNEDDDDMDGDGVNNDEDKDDDGDGVTDLQEFIDAIRRFIDWVRDTVQEIAQ